MPFDYRDLLGGAGAKVTADPVLADGINGNAPMPGICAHLTKKHQGSAEIIEWFARTLLANANFHELCPGALYALVLERIGQLAVLHLPADQLEYERSHFLGEIRTVLEAMERGDA